MGARLVAVTIEATADGVVLSDAGEFRSLARDDTESFDELLNCAGAELELVGDIATITIDDPDDTARAVLSLAHYVIAAPVLWHARRCLAEEGRDQQEPSAVRALAKATKQRLISRFGDSVGTVIRLNAPIKDRGERAIAPMVMARQTGARPMLISTLVDYEATPAAVSNAKRTSEWV